MSAAQCFVIFFFICIECGLEQLFENHSPCLKPHLIEIIRLCIKSLKLLLGAESVLTGEVCRSHRE